MKFKKRVENWIVVRCSKCDNPVPIKFDAKLRACWFSTKCSDCGKDVGFKYFHKIPNTQELVMTIATEKGVKGVCINKDNWKKVEI